MNYVTWKYSAGEVGLRLADSNKQSFLINSSDDLMSMLLYLSARKEAGEPVLKIHIPYLPYSRQDRVVTWGDPMPLDIIANALQNLGVTTVTTEDLHSPKNIIPIFEKHSINLINQYPLSMLVKEYTGKPVILVCVDDGCSERVDYLRTSIGGDACRILLGKKRDPKTGAVIGMEWLFCDNEIEHLPAGETTVLVYDDICDGGATFIGAAEVIRTIEILPKNVKMHLHVTHGIFSKGMSELEKHYDLITFKNRLNPQT